MSEYHDKEAPHAATMSVQDAEKSNASSDHTTYNNDRVGVLKSTKYGVPLVPQPTEDPDEPLVSIRFQELSILARISLNVILRTGVSTRSTPPLLFWHSTLFYSRQRQH